MANKPEAESSTQHPLLDDRALVEACLKGDSGAWEALIKRYKRLIYSIPIKIGFSPIDAADVFQSVCVRMLERLSTLRDHGKISSWLMTTTTRECWRVAAHQRREKQSPVYDEAYERDLLDNLAAAEPLADQQRIAFEREQVVREALAKLAERCRTLVTLLFYHKEELSYGEIAGRLGIPLNSLGPTRARCLKKLKKLLEGKL